MDFTKRAPTAFEKTLKIKSVQELGMAYNHNYRKGDIPANAENERSYLNEELIQLEHKDFNAALNAIKKEHNIVPRKDAVLALEVIMEPQHVDGSFDLEAWKKQSAKWVQDYFGKDNVISAVYHADESQPHIHAMVIPVVDGKLRCYKFTNGKDKLSEMQSSYAKAVENLGLERGMEKTPVSYEVMQKLRATTGKVASEDLPPPEQGESMEEFYLRVNEHYKDMKLMHFRKQNEIQVGAEKQIELAKRESVAAVAEAKEKVEEAQREVKEIQKMFRTLLDENSDLKKEVKDLEVKLQVQQADFSRYLQEGLSMVDLRRLNNINNVFEAFNQNLLGEKNQEKKEIMLDIMNEALNAFNQAENTLGERMDEREQDGVDIASGTSEALE